jgi:threonyl-tRNA synthetase
VSLRSRREGELGSVAVANLLAAAVTANAERAAGLGLPAVPTPGQ